MDMFKRIVQLEQRRSHGKYALGGGGSGVVRELEQSLVMAGYEVAPWHSDIPSSRSSRLIESRNPDSYIGDDEISILQATLGSVNGQLGVAEIAEDTGLDRRFIREQLSFMERGRLVARIAPSSDVWRITHFGEACVRHKKSKKVKKKLKEWGAAERRKFDSSKYKKSTPPDVALRDKSAQKVINLMLSKAENQGGGVWVYNKKIPEKHLGVLRSAARNRIFAVRPKPGFWEYVWGGPNIRLTMRDHGTGKMLLKAQVFTNESKEYKAQGALEKAVGQMYFGQSGKWLSKGQMGAIVKALESKGITEPTKNTYDDIARAVGKALSKVMK